MSQESVLRRASDEQLKGLWQRDDLSEEKRNELRVEMSRRLQSEQQQTPAPTEPEGPRGSYQERFLRGAGRGVANMATGAAQLGAGLLTQPIETAKALGSGIGEAVTDLPVVQAGKAFWEGKPEDVPSMDESIRGTPVAGRLYSAAVDEGGDFPGTLGEMTSEGLMDLYGGKALTSIPGIKGLPQRLAREAGEVVEGVDVPILPSQTAAGMKTAEEIAETAAKQAQGISAKMPEVAGPRARAELMTNPKSRAMRRYDEGQDQRLRTAQERLIKDVSDGTAADTKVSDAMSDVLVETQRSVDRLDDLSSQAYTRLDHEVNKAWRSGRIVGRDRIPVTRDGRPRMVDTGGLEKVADDALKALEESDAVIGSRTAITVQRQLERLLKGVKKTNGDAASFRAAQNARSRLRKQIAKETDPQAAQALREVLTELDQSIDSGLQRFGEAVGDPDMSTRWRQANDDYRTMVEITKDPSIQAVMSSDPGTAASRYYSLKPAARKKLEGMLRQTDEGAAALDQLRGSMLHDRVFQAGTAKTARKNLQSMKDRGMLTDAEMKRALELTDLQDRIKSGRQLRHNEAFMDVMGWQALIAYTASTFGVSIPAALAASLLTRTGMQYFAGLYVTNPAKAGRFLRAVQMPSAAVGGATPFAQYPQQLVERGQDGSQN